MTADRPALLERIAARLERAGAGYAIIGAAAMAVHGISRSTGDIDVAASDRRVLDATFWRDIGPDVAVDVRAGDASDPLAGVVRFSAAGDRDVDLVVVRGDWVAGVIARAVPTPHGGRTLPIATVADLILLKLYAGGSQDRWDIEQLLSLPGPDDVVAAVERELPRLPRAARDVWAVVRLGPPGA